jgi:methyl-accepting chemotaxis protein
VGEVNDATAEQATKMEQVNAGVVQIDTVTQANAASAEELAGNAHELKDHSARLRDGVAGLKKLIDGQLDTDPAFRTERDSRPKPSRSKPKQTRQQPAERRTQVDAEQACDAVESF